MDAANRLLRTGRGRELTKRTVRYYVSQGLIPPPLGPSKFARYTYQHLLLLLIVRASLDHGHRLELIAKNLADLESAPDEALEAEAARWLRGEHSEQHKAFESSFAAGMVMEPALEYASPGPAFGKLVLRIELTRHTTLEVDAGADLRSELRAALAELRRKVD